MLLKTSVIDRWF